MQAPIYADVVAAREFSSPYLPKTPLVRSHKISEALGCDYYLKLENLQPTRRFQSARRRESRGPRASRGRNETLVTASTGNHGQSIAYAGRLFNRRVIIYAPTENVNPAKLQAMRELGAEVRLHGRDFDEARLETERVANAEGFRYVHSANEPHLVAGVGDDRLGDL